MVVGTAARAGQMRWDGQPAVVGIPASARARLAGLMQEGQWQEAENALQEIEACYGRSATADLRELLALHRSAEQSWEQGRRGGSAAIMQTMLRVLLVADGVLLVLLSVLGMLGHMAGIL